MTEVPHPRPPSATRLDQRASDDAIRDATARARRAWPRIDLPDGIFAEALASRMEAWPGGAAEAIAHMNVDEVYLAVACARGDDAALAELEERYWGDVRATLARRGLSPGDVDETEQAVREMLLVATATRRPRILEFGGRGQLRGWLRAVASRVGIRLMQSRRRDVTFDDSFGAAGGEDLELAYLKKTYGETFRRAFDEALATLPVRDRILLKQRFALHMTVTELGALYGVNASSVSRWVTSARHFLVAATREGMMRRLHLGRAEVSSILRLIHSELDITLSSAKAVTAAG